MAVDTPRAPMPRRKLVLVTPRYGQAQGGLGNSAARIAAHLRSAHDLLVIEQTPELPPATLRELSPQHLQIAASGDSKTAQQHLVDVLLRHAPDREVLGFFAGASSLSLWMATQLSGRALVLCARGNDVDQEPFGAEGGKILLAWERARGVLCVTRELEQKVRAWAPAARTIWVPNGIDVQRYPVGEPSNRAARSGPLRIGIFGEMKRKKGLELLLAALDPAHFTLRIVGSLRPEVEKYLHGLLTLDPSLAGVVRHVPYVETHQALLEEYAQVDLVCVPSLHEGMSNVMLEAMALQKVIVASRVGGALDLLEHQQNAITFEVMQDGALREALELARQADHTALGCAARRTVEAQFSAEQERSRTLAALEQLLS